MRSFFSSSHPSLKVCGITLRSDAENLAEMGVEALGINFWERSKRYCSPEQAEAFSPDLKGEILRVGVYVNAPINAVIECFQRDLIDVAQFHGDETLDYLKEFKKSGHPFIKALGVEKDGTLPPLSPFPTSHLLLDAHAPGVYGGTGKTIDWSVAETLVKENPDKSILLAGGITPENAREAAMTVKPCALDVASGAESSPGVKDFDKIKRLQEALSL